MFNFKMMRHGAMALGVSIAISQPSFAVNPIVQTIYTADAAPLVHNGRLYVYTGHDEDNVSWFTMKEWHCYSTTDMVNWTDHGSPLGYADFSWAKQDAWASQCIERDGKFYFYAPVIQKTGERVIGVAVSDSPTGPFEDAIGKPLIVHTGGDIDPTVFIDDDGQAYLYWGNTALKYAKLNKDMVSIDTSIGDKGIMQVPLTVEGFGKINNGNGTSFVEGPWFYKRNGLYYMLYAAGGFPENIAYSTAPTATGPWTYRGIIMDAQGSSFTNHPSIIDYKGHSYFVYHNGALPGGWGYARSVCLEEFKYNADGSIPKMSMTTEGTPAIATLNPYARTEAETIAWESGVETEPCAQGGMNVRDIESGDYIRVKNVDFGATGAGTFMASVASDTKPKASRSSAIELHLDSADGPLVGTLPVSFTGGFNNWKTATTAVAGAQGVHDLFLVFKGEASKDLFHFDYWKFAQKSATPRLVAVNASTDLYKIGIAPTDDKANLTVRAIYSDGTSKDVTSEAKISSQKPGLVKVAKGVISGAASGTTNLGVSFGGMTDTLPLILKDLKTEYTVRNLKPSVGDVSLINGSNRLLSVTAEYADGHTEDVTKTATYTVGQAEVAEVKDGKISGKQPGSTLINLSFQSEMGAAASSQVKVTVTNRDPFVQNEAEDFSEQQGIVVEDSTEAGKDIGVVQNGDWIKFNAIDFGAGATSFEARVATATNGGTLEVHLDRPDGPLVGSFGVGYSGGWQNWVTRQCEIKGATGIHDLYLKFVGGGGDLFNTNWWKFTKATN